MSDWKPDPTFGGEHIEARKEEAIGHLKSAANVAFYHIEQQLERDIEDLRKKAGDTKQKVNRDNYAGWGVNND